MGSIKMIPLPPLAKGALHIQLEEFANPPQGQKGKTNTSKRPINLSILALPTSVASQSATNMSTSGHGTDRLNQEVPYPLLEFMLLLFKSKENKISEKVRVNQPKELRLIGK